MGGRETDDDDTLDQVVELNEKEIFVRQKMRSRERREILPITHKERKKTAENPKTQGRERSRHAATNTGIS